MTYIDEIMQEFNNLPELEVIASKTYEANGTTVTAEMSVMRDKTTGEILNGSCYAYYNGIFHNAQDYRDAMRIAQEIVECIKAGKDYKEGC